MKAMSSRSPGSAPVSRNPERTQQRILNAGFTAFAGKGFAGARVDSIARRGGRCRRPHPRPTKDGLLVECIHGETHPAGYDRVDLVSAGLPATYEAYHGPVCLRRALSNRAERISAQIRGSVRRGETESESSSLNSRQRAQQIQIQMKDMMGIFGSIIALVWAAALCGCSGKASEARKTAGTRPSVPVITAQAEAQDVPIELRNIGNVEPYSLVAIRSQITGQITKIHFLEG